MLGQGAVHAGDLPEEFPLRPRASWIGWAGKCWPEPGRLVPGLATISSIDLDSTVCETYGLCKEGVQRHNYADQRGYHPLRAVAAGTGPPMAD